MKKIICFIATAICFLFFVLSFIVYSFSHSGRTDSSGGHYDSSTGKYHYHHGYPAHQHTNGKCPYNFDDKTNSESNNSTLKTTEYDIGDILGITFVTVILSFTIFIFIASSINSVIYRFMLSKFKKDIPDESKFWTITNIVIFAIIFIIIFNIFLQ